MFKSFKDKKTQKLHKGENVSAFRAFLRQVKYELDLIRQDFQPTLDKITTRLAA